MSKTETIRETCEMELAGRIVIPYTLRQALNLLNVKAYCQVENYGEDKILITILRRWVPSKKGPGKDVVKT